MARNPGTTSNGSSFDEATIEAVWRKGTPEPNYPSFRKDVCNASMQRSKHAKTEQFGWEIDHIKPVSKGGSDDLSNLPCWERDLEDRSASGLGWSAASSDTPWTRNPKSATDGDALRAVRSIIARMYRTQRWHGAP